MENNKSQSNKSIDSYDLLENNKDDQYVDILKSIVESNKDLNIDSNKNSSQIFDTLKKSLLDKESLKASKNNQKDEIKLEYLKVVDFNYDDIFQIEIDFKNAYETHLNPQKIANLNNQLSSVNLIEYFENERKSENKYSKAGMLSNLIEMVESTYCYINDYKFQMAEEISYLEKIVECWRPINGDGNCFYRSVMFAYLENLVFQKDIYMLKRIASEIFQRFNINHSKTAKFNKIIRDSYTQLNIPTVIAIFYLIIDILDGIDARDKIGEEKRIKAAYEILIKGFNLCKSFDLVNYLNLI